MSRYLDRIARKLPTENDAAIDVFDEAEFVGAENKYYISSKTVRRAETDISDYDYVIIHVRHLPPNVLVDLYDKAHGVFFSTDEVDMLRNLDYEKCLNCGRNFRRPDSSSATLCRSCFLHKIPLYVYERDEEEKKRADREYDLYQEEEKELKKKRKVDALPEEEKSEE